MATSGVWPYGRNVVSPYGRYVVWPYQRYVVRYDGNSTFNQHNRFFPTGQWNPETLELRVEAPGHWNLRRLEPQVHMGGERAPTREPAKGTDPRNGLYLFRYPLGSHWRSLRCASPSHVAHGGYDVLGWCMLLAGLSFPETLEKPRGGAGQPSWLLPFVKLHFAVTRLGTELLGLTSVVPLC